MQNGLMVRLRDFIYLFPLNKEPSTGKKEVSLFVLTFWTDAGNLFSIVYKYFLPRAYRVTCIVQKTAANRSSFLAISPINIVLDTIPFFPKSKRGCKQESRVEALFTLFSAW